MTQDTLTKPASDNDLNLLEHLIKQALKGGADAADAVAIDARSKSISYREGKLEDVDASEGEDIGLRVMIGKQQAMASTSDRSAASLSTLIERTLEMARAVPEDTYCGLAPECMLASAPHADLDLYDPTQVSAETLGELARTAEDVSRSIEGISGGDGAGASASSWSIALATSHGFTGHYKGSSFSLSASAIAGTGLGMERDYDYTSKRFFADMASATEVGRNAGENAVARLNPTRVKSGILPVVFGPRVSNSLVGHFLGAISGPSIARKSSFLMDKMGEAVFSNSINITDDPTLKRGLKSRPFDGEGVRAQKTALLKDGRLQTWLLNSASARQLGLDVTGHASRSTSGAPGISTSNVYMENGAVSVDELIKDIPYGVYISELIGMGVNGVTGDYSRGAAGFLIEGGTLTRPVSEFTIAGNLISMFENLIPANNLEFKYGVNAPTVRIDGMTIASS